MESPHPVVLDTLAAYVDFSQLRLGDRMASAWYAQHRRRRTGERFGALDRHLLIPEPFPMELYFPDTFTRISEGDVARLNLKAWDQTVLWLNATNEFARHPVDGCFEHIPTPILARVREQQPLKRKERPRVLMHVLDDATYNHKRNWRRADAMAVSRALESKGCDVVLLNPEHGHFTGNYQDMMVQMLLADAFIGGDTGPSHLFAQLCPEKPQIAVYPDMTEDQETYRSLQELQKLPAPWSSLPKKRNLTVITLVPARALSRSGFWFKRRKYQRFYPSDVLRALLPALKLAR